MRFKFRYLFLIVFAGFSLPALTQNELLSERAWISIRSQEGAYNETLIAFKEGASVGIDSTMDAPKLEGNGILALATRITDRDFAIQALPPLNMDYEIQLVIEAIAGNQEMKVEELSNFPEAGQIIIEDIKLGVFHNLRNSNYPYTYEPGADTFRFKAHFLPPPFLIATGETCVGNDGVISISSNSASTWNLSITDSDSLLIDQVMELSGDFQLDSLAPGIYKLVFTNGYGTRYEQAVEILPAQLFSFSIISDKDITDIHEPEIIFSAVGNDADSIHWDLGDGTFMTGINEFSHSYSNAGIYNVTAVAFKDACSYTASRVITISDITTEINELDKYSLVYPNPASDVINIKNIKGEINNIILIDLTGKTILNQTGDGNENVDIKNIPEGVYSLIIISEKSIQNSRVVIQH